MISEKDLFADTVVLSNFVFSGLFEDLLRFYNNRLKITTQVLDEIESGIAAGYTQLGLNHEAVKDYRIETIQLNKNEYDFFSALLKNLGRGEASCISCAHQRKAVTATDDRAARLVCREHKVRLTGTLGILKSMVGSNSITHDAGETALQLMIKAGFYSPIKRLEDIL